MIPTKTFLFSIELLVYCYMPYLQLVQLVSTFDADPKTHRMLLSEAFGGVKAVMGKRGTHFCVQIHTNSIPLS